MIFPLYSVQLLEYMFRHPGFVLLWGAQLPDNKIATEFATDSGRRFHGVLSAKEGLIKLLKGRLVARLPAHAGVVGV
jgi:hypothetical protein